MIGKINLIQIKNSILFGYVLRRHFSLFAWIKCTVLTISMVINIIGVINNKVPIFDPLNPRYEANVISKDEVEDKEHKIIHTSNTSEEVIDILDSSFVFQLTFIISVDQSSYSLMIIMNFIFWNSY